jgi:hypothetical protein
MEGIKNVLLNWYFSMQKKFRKISIIFDIEIDFESQILALFDKLPIQIYWQNKIFSFE